MMAEDDTRFSSLFQKVYGLVARYTLMTMLRKHIQSTYYYPDLSTFQNCIKHYFYMTIDGCVEVLPYCVESL